MKTKSFFFLLLAMLVIACGQSVNDDQTEHDGEVDYLLTEHSTIYAQWAFKRLGFDKHGTLLLNKEQSSNLVNRLVVIEGNLRKESLASYEYDSVANRTTTQFPRGTMDDQSVYVDSEGFKYRMIVQLEKNQPGSFWARLSLGHRTDLCGLHELDVVVWFDEEGKATHGNLYTVEYHSCTDTRSNMDPKVLLEMKVLSSTSNFYDFFIETFEELKPLKKISRRVFVKPRIRLEE